MAVGQKQLETRSWRTNYRGLIAIHAAKKWGADQKEITTRYPYRVVLPKFVKDNEYAFGCVLAVGMLTGIYSTKSVKPRLPNLDTPHEEAFGDYRFGRWAWHIQQVKQLPKPLPATGGQGLWWFDIHDYTLKQLGFEVR